MEIIDVVKKLVGKIDPIGETRIDNERLENLKILTALVEGLIEDIYAVSKNKNCPEYSRQEAGMYAACFLEHVRVNY